MTGEWVRVDLDLVASVGVDAALAYGLIAYRCQGRGVWQATREQIAADTRLTEHRTRRSLQALRDTGLIESRRADRFNPTLTWRVCPGQAVKEDSSVTTGRLAPSLETVKSSVSLSPKNVKNPPTPAGGAVEEGALFGDVTPVTPRPAVDPDPEAFDAFWSAYPRKVGKGAARKAWEKITRTVDPAVIVAGLTRQARSLTDAHERGYCPHPSTWLNQERWADEVDNVTSLSPTRPDLSADYDPTFAATLPPPRTDPFAAGGRW